MSPTRGAEEVRAETERVRGIQDKMAPRYDRMISFFEKLLFGGGREWVCSRAEDDVLEIAAGTARNLPFYPDDVRITAVEVSPEMRTLGLCTIPDERRAVAEARRVLCPGGRLLLLEHVRSPAPLVRTVQRLLDPLTVWFEGDHLLRDPLDYLAAEGFEVEELERSKWGIVERVVARRPA